MAGLDSNCFGCFVDDSERDSERLGGAQLFGHGCYPAASMFNHSCAPNCNASTGISLMQVTTDVELRRDEELCIACACPPPPK